MSEKTLRERVASMTKDRRAWIPFAVIGVLLLVLSTVVVVSLETREDPEPEIDEQLAFDRGEASAQAALRAAVRDAATEAGDAPVVSLDGVVDAENDVDEKSDSPLRKANVKRYIESHKENSFLLCEYLPCLSEGNIEGYCDYVFDFLCNTEESNTDQEVCEFLWFCEGPLEFEDLPDHAQENHIFKNYVRLLIYQQTAEYFEGAGQEIRETETEVSLRDKNDNLTEKIERVNLTIGHNSDQLGAGMVGASIEGVEMRVLDDGELVDQQVETLNVTVATTLFELHNRTQEYESLLNTGFFDGLPEALEEGRFKGFGQEFGARLYPIAYAKSGVKYFKPSLFQEIASNRQSEILANHAIYAIQRDAFGVSDPESSTEMIAETACLAVNIVEEQIRGFIGDYIDNGDLTGDASGKINETLQSFISDEDVAGSIADKVVNKAGGEIAEEFDEEGFDLTEIVCGAIRSFVKDDENATDALPGFSDLLGGLDTDSNGVEGKRNVSINTSAALAYLELTENNLEPNFESPPPEDWKHWKETLNLSELTTVREGGTVINYSDQNKSTEKIHETLTDAQSDKLKRFYQALEKDDIDASKNIKDIIATVSNVKIDDSVEPHEPPGEVDEPELPDDEGWALINDSVSVTTTPHVSISEEYSPKNPDRNETFYEVVIDVEQEITKTKTWECTDINSTHCDYGDTHDEEESGTTHAGTDITIEGEYSPGIDIDHADDRKLQYAYEEGGDAGPGPGFDNVNFEGIPEHVLNDSFELENAEKVTEETVEAQLEQIDEKIGSVDVADESGYTGPEEGYCAIDNGECNSHPGAQDIEPLSDWLEQQLTTMVYGVGEENFSKIGPPGGYPADSLLNRSKGPNIGQIQIGLTKFLENESSGLLYGLKNKVGEAEGDVVYQDLEGAEFGAGGPKTYENLADLARAQLYKQYLNRINKSIDTTDAIRTRHAQDGLFAKTVGLISQGLGMVGSAVEKTLGGLLGNVTEFGQQALDIIGGPDEEAGEIESPLFEDVTFEIDGSPTYLSGKSGEGVDNTDTREDTPAVRPGEKGPFAGTDSDNFFSGESVKMPEPEGTNYSTMYSAYGNPLPYPGLPVVPAIHAVQASLWNVEVGGEYPRFEVSATTGDPASTTAYVRENRTVDVEIAGEQTTVGSVEPINFESRTLLGVLMPPGGGVGDGGPSAWTNPSDLVSLFSGCQAAYPRLGPGYEEFDIIDFLPEDMQETTEDIKKSVNGNGDGGVLENINEKFPIVDPLPADAVKEAKKQADCLAAQLLSLTKGLFEDNQDNN